MLKFQIWFLLMVKKASSGGPQSPIGFPGDCAVRRCAGGGTPQNPGGPGTPIAFHIGVPTLYCDLAWPPRQWHTSLPGGPGAPGDLNRGPETFGIQNLGPPARSHDFIPQRPWGPNCVPWGAVLVPRGPCVPQLWGPGVPWGPPRYKIDTPILLPHWGLRA